VDSFTPQPLYPRGKGPGIYVLGGWVGPRAGLDVNKRWKKMHNEELHNLNTSPNNSDKIREKVVGEVCSKQKALQMLNI
jgi:hypothetical protein